MRAARLIVYALGIAVAAGAGWSWFDSRRAVDREEARKWREATAEADYRLSVDLKALDANKDLNEEGRRAALLRLLEKHPGAGADRLEGMIGATYLYGEKPDMEEALKWYLKVDYAGLSRAPRWNSLWHYAQSMMSASVCAELLGRPKIADDCLSRAEQAVKDSEYGRDVAKTIRPSAGVEMLWAVAQSPSLTSEEKEKRALAYLERHSRIEDDILERLQEQFVWLLKNRPEARDVVQANIRALYPERMRKQLDQWLAGQTKESAT